MNNRITGQIASLLCLGTGLFKRHKMHRRWCKHNDDRQAAKKIQGGDEHGLPFEPLAFDNE